MLDITEMVRYYVPDKNFWKLIKKTKLVRQSSRII